MSPRRIPDRAPVEAELSPAQAAALRQSCEAAGIQPDRWPQVPALRTWAVFSAASNRVARLVDAGESRTSAIGSVAARFDIGEKGLEKLLGRARKAARRLDKAA